MDLVLFNGESVSFPDIPDGYRHFVILDIGSTPKRYYLVGYNDYLKCYPRSGVYYFVVDDGSPFDTYFVIYWEPGNKYNSKEWEHNNYYQKFQAFDPSYSSIVYADVSSLKDDLLNWNYIEYTHTDTIVLASIVDEQDMSPGVIFGEIFDILPILLVVLVSFIGIRKGISYLFSLLKKS